MANFPVAGVSANHGVGTTAIIALMVGWILQNTCTIPGFTNVTLLDVLGA
jgi:hypothetical protein